MREVSNRYASYQRGEHPWLDQIPSHWLEKRAKVSFREIDERSAEGNEELLSVSHMTGVTPRSQKNVTMFKAASYAGHKLCRPGDIVINTMWAWMGALGESRHTGIVSPAYGVYRLHREGTFVPGYLDYLLRTCAYISEYICQSTGIRSSRLRLYPDKFLRIPLLQPPIEEQQSIVGYLRAQDHEIAKLIRSKRRLIELLNEQKQTIIHRAVTRGLNPDVPLKPSGVDWLGDVPAHWDVCPLKAIGNVQFSGVDKHSHDDELPIKLCNYTDVYKNDFITSDMNFMVATATEAEIMRFRLAVGDVLLTKDSETPDDIGVPALVCSVPESGAVCGYHLAMIRPKAMIAIGEFIFRTLSDRVVARQFHIAANGVTRFGLTKAEVKRAVIPLPGLNEQKKICAHIAAEFAPINESIATTKREIALIREYRDRLISDVVTGQIDVRGWQPEPYDESDAEPLTALSEVDENGESLDDEEVSDV